MRKRPPATLADAMAINRIADRIRAAKQSDPAQKPSVDTSPERLGRLARYLDELPPGPTTHIHDLHEETAAALRALLAERDAAFAAGQDDMRERAARDVAEFGRLYLGNGDDVTADVVKDIRALPLKDSPDGR